MYFSKRFDRVAKALTYTHIHYLSLIINLSHRTKSGIVFATRFYKNICKKKLYTLTNA